MFAPVPCHCFLATLIARARWENRLTKAICYGRAHSLFITAFTLCQTVILCGLFNVPRECVIFSNVLKADA